jgi:hypothetical protein
MGSLLLPMTANFFIEDFEEVAYKTTCWFCYVDDTFMIYAHGPEQMNDCS